MYLELTIRLSTIGEGGEVLKVVRKFLPLIYPNSLLYLCMPNCFFVSDLHGHTDRCEKLFSLIGNEIPDALFVGGDIMPSANVLKHSIQESYFDFIDGFFAPEFIKLKDILGPRYPKVFLILGNDDGKFIEMKILEWEKKGIWEYIHFKKTVFAGHNIYGYSFVPPTPFRLKDWEKYDVSRYVDPGCVSPEDGFITIPANKNELKYGTIKNDLELLTGKDPVNNSIFLFHSPPYKTNLDEAPLKGKSIDGVPLDINVGSIAIRKFIEIRQPLITLHGHIHESSTLTGSWKDKIGDTYCFSAAYEGKELALVRFDPDEPDKAKRELV
jgi:uncharacterized protein